MTEGKSLSNGIENQFSLSAFSKIYNSAPIGIILLRANKVLFANPHLIKILGYQSENEIIGKNISNFIPEIYHESIQQWNRTRSDFELEVFRGLDKSIIPIHIDVTRIELPDGFATLVFVQDITKRKLAEIELENTLERYKILIDFAPIGIVLSRGGKIILANTHFSKIFGIDHSENIKDFETINVIHPDYRKALLERRTRRKEGLDEPRSYNIVGLKNNDIQFPMHLTVDFIELPDGPAVLTFVQDISDQKNAENVLKESKEHYKLLVDKAPEAIVVYDVELGHFVDANANAEKLFKRSRDELLRAGPLDISLTHLPDGRLTKKSIEGRLDIVLSGEMSTFEWIIINGDGDQVEVEARLVRLPSASRKLIRGSIIDITERKKEEQELRVSQERYKTLVEYAPESILLIDWDLGKFIDINENAEKLFKMSRSELLESGPVDVSPEYQPNKRRSIDAVVDVISQAITGNRPTFEWIFLDSARNEIHCEVRLIKMPSSERVLVRASVIDISQRKRQENELKSTREQLYRSQKMEALGRIAGGIAHDFNNSLTLIKGYSSLLLKDIPEILPSHSYVTKILEASDNAAALTKQLLSISRRRVLTPEIVNLNNVLTKIQGMLKRVIPGNIKLSSRLDHQLKNAKVDPIQIEHVIINLVINARDALPEGGEIIIATANVVEPPNLSRYREDISSIENYIVLSVSDNGIGMDEKTQNFIFEPFFTTKESTKGTGLGLATSYGIINQSGGFFDVESSIGKGTTFYIYLPSVDEKQVTKIVETTTQSEEDLRDKKQTIFVIDDERSVEKLVSEILRRNGYSVIDSNLPKEALELSKKFKDRIDLIISDVVMPDMNGFELVNRILSDHPDTKVLFITGYSRDASVLKEVQNHGYRILEKPFTDSNLLTIVNDILL